MKRMIDTLTETEAASIEAAFAEICRSVLPADWHCREAFGNAAWYIHRGGLRVCVEVEMNESDRWIHVSLSRPDRIPTYNDLKLVKELFIGADRKAIQILPSRSEHYNLHEFCLHLYSPFDKDPLPDFRHSTGAL